jgi:hypothetical protein
VIKLKNIVEESVNEDFWATPAPFSSHDTKEKALKQLAAIEISKHIHSELKEMVKEVLTEAGTSSIGGYDFGKSNMGDSANIHMTTGYPRTYTVIGRAFYNRADGAGHSYKSLYTVLLNNRTDEVVINALNLGTGDSATAFRSSLEAFGMDSRFPSDVRNIVYEFLGIPDPLLTSLRRYDESWGRSSTSWFGGGGGPSKPMDKNMPNKFLINIPTLKDAKKVLKKLKVRWKTAIDDLTKPGIWYFRDKKGVTVGGWKETQKTLYYERKLF